MCHSTERSLLGTATLRAPCSFNDQTPHASHELCPSPPCCAVLFQALCVRVVPCCDMHAAIGQPIDASNIS